MTDTYITTNPNKPPTTQRHVPLKHQAEEAERKAAAAKRGLRAVLAELKGMYKGQVRALVGSRLIVID